MPDQTDHESIPSTLAAEIDDELDALVRDLSQPGRKRDQAVEFMNELRQGRKVSDFRFDQIFPPSVRRLSSTHWTPVDVASHAAKLLVTSPKTRVLDVGSGCGKFCTIGALVTSGQFVGVEQRPHLYRVAQRVTQALNIPNSSFLLGNMVDLDLSPFDAFYLFNPFYEHQTDYVRIDNSILFSSDQFTRYIEAVRTLLRAAPSGTRVATYHGFGGDMPTGYERIRRDPIGTSYVELWVKSGAPQ